MGVLNRLTLTHLKMNKKRTIVSIIGIVLSTALMVGVGLLFSTARDAMIRETIDNKGSYHAIIHNVTNENLDSLKNNKEIKELTYDQGIGTAYLEGSLNPDKPYLYLLTGNDAYLKQLKLVSGRLPENNNEIVISEHISYNGGVEFELQSEITLNIGDRVDKDDNLIIGNASYKEDELINLKEHTYTIVGIVERSNYEDYSAAGYSIYTKEEISSNHKLNAYITYKSESNIRSRALKQANDFGLSDTDVSYNEMLLSLYGDSKYDNYNSTIFNIMAIFLGLIAVACIIVIYNSFAISVSERKKQFGLLSSIGATKSQIKRMVFFEATIVGIIGIIVGILSSIFGIGVLLRVINELLKEALAFELELSLYPSFIIIPVIFMIVTVLLSAYIPALRASKITPIEAIRQNDDIKIKAKKLKTNKLVKKLFGVEGELALKNIKRNKKKYRITIVSLFISIVLFISFSCFLNYAFGSIYDISTLPNFDIEIDYLADVDDDAISTFRKLEKNGNVKNSLFIKGADEYLLNDNSSKYYSEQFDKYICDALQYISLYVVDDNNYNNIIKKYSLNKNEPILLNRMKHVEYSDSGKKNYAFKIFDSNNFSLDFCNEEENKKCFTLKDFNILNDELFGTDFILSSSSNSINVLVTSDMYKSYEDELSTFLTIMLDVNNEKEFKNDFTAITNSDYSYLSVKEQMSLVSNLVLAIKILLYGFITLVTLIGVTSVFNTISTSIALRRREFAMLRSIGLDPKGFNRILYFESLFFGLKSLVISVIASFGVMYLIHISMGSVYSIDHILIPWASIIVAVFAVFGIVLITMMYSSSKLKKENILDSIRDENI